MPAQGSSFRLTLPRVPGREIVSSPLPLPPTDAGELPEGLPAADGTRPVSGSEARA